MRQIINLVRQDLTVARRDSIILYMIVGPLLLALAVRAFVPSVGQARLAFAVDRGVGPEIISELARYGGVEIYESRGEVTRRVEEPDVVPGVVQGGGRLVLLLEGNESEGLAHAYQAVLRKVSSGQDLAHIAHVSLGENRSFLFELLTIMLVMTAMFLGGAVAGLNIVDERDSKTIRAVAVSPLKFSRFIAARGLLAVMLGGVIAIGSSLVIVGPAISYGRLVLGILASAALATLVCLTLGALANNQITALAAIKVIMPVYLLPPLVSVFVSDAWQFLFYPLPSYWQFQAFRNIYMGPGGLPAFWLAWLLTLGTGATALLVFFRVLRGRFQLR